ncbi:MAG TPA: phospholipase A [Solimonas sp.]|nr:phospholipase A [Solimonas sp.]
MRTTLLILAALLPLAVTAAPIAVPGEELPVIPLASKPEPIPRTDRQLFENMGFRPEAFELVEDSPGLSFHKPMFALPYSWAENINGGENPEAFFQISFKQRIPDIRLWGGHLFLAYTQKSFWQVYNGQASRPFRETDYNPEAFLRWTFPQDSSSAFGLDLGAEHESNGKAIPDSRSWNRSYAAGFWKGARTLAYLKLWYRWPESENRAPDDPERDDNPDINDYYGYGELQLQHEPIRGRQDRIGTMARFSPRTGKGAINLNYSAPIGGSYAAYWNVYFWQGYGESLFDYNRNTMRVGVGVSFSR